MRSIHLLGAIALALGLSMPSRAGAERTAPGPALSHRTWTEFGDPLQPPGVYAITQDADGYLWLGLLNGLTRFDGAQFMRWDALARPPLPERSVTALAAAPDGALWIGYGNLGGISRYAGGQIRHFTSRDGVPEGAIRTLLVARDGTPWALGYGGLARFHHDGWHLVGLEDGMPPGLIDYVREDAAGTLWAVKQGRVFRRNSSGHFEVLQAGTPPGMVLGSAFIRALGPVNSASALTSASPTLPPHAISDRSGRVWASDQEGLVVVEPSGAVTRLTTREGLTGARVNALFEDRQGHIWIGTPGGLDVMSAPDASTPTVWPPLAGEHVRAVVAHEADVWVGTAHGLLRLTRGTVTRLTTSDGLPDNRVTALHRDAQGTLWIATDNGIAIMRDFRIRRVTGEAGGLVGVTSIATAADGTAWFCTFGEVYRSAGGRLLSSKAIPALAGQRAGVVYGDHLGRVWIGLWGGAIARYDRGLFETYTGADGLSAGRVTTITEDHHGVIWVGSLNGLSRLDGSRFVTPGRKSSLSGLMVSSIYRDRRDRLWLRTLSGLIRLPVREFQRAVESPQHRPLLKVFAPPPGTTLGPTGEPSLAAAPDSTLWVPLDTGLLKMPLDREGIDAAPPVRIEGVAVDDRPVVPSGTVQLRAGVSRVRFDYTAVELLSASQLTFRYRLDGFDKDWVDAGRLRQAVYTNLPPGQYQFRVAASNGGSPWGEVSLDAPIRVLPAFYQTSWFFGGCLAVGALVLWGAWHARVRRLRWQYVAVLAERARLGREIHDTLLQGMVGVALQLHSLLDGPRDEDGFRSRVARARDTLEHYIREARYSIWDLRSPALERLDLAEAIRLAGRDLTEASGSSFELSVTGTPVRCAPQVEAHLLRIAHEAISNAVRHSRATQVTVTVEYVAGGVRVIIQDDGVGFNAEEVTGRTGQQWGLSTMRERAEQIGADFRCLSSPRGTTVEAAVQARS